MSLIRPRVVDEVAGQNRCFPSRRGLKLRPGKNRVSVPIPFEVAAVAISDITLGPMADPDGLNTKKLIHKVSATRLRQEPRADMRRGADA